MIDAKAATLTYFPYLGSEYASEKQLGARTVIKGGHGINVGTIDYSAVPASDNEFSSHYAKLKRIESDQSVWPEGAERPAQHAIVWAKSVLERLEADALVPTRVVASAEGGVAICFVSGNKYSDIECLNSGTILGVTSDRRSRPFVWEVDQGPSGIARASVWIRQFLYPP